MSHSAPNIAPRSIRQTSPRSRHQTTKLPVDQSLLALTDEQWLELQQEVRQQLLLLEAMPARQSKLLAQLAPMRENLPADAALCQQLRVAIEQQQWELVAQLLSNMQDASPLMGFCTLLTLLLPPAS